jgi:uncharacterized protein (TIGR02145 family)
MSRLKIIQKIVFFSLILFPGFSFSQGEWNNWVFGVHAGITFNTVPPSPFNNIIPFFSGDPSSATASDSTGNLLFYACDAHSGHWVFNRNNLLMPNGLLFNNLPESEGMQSLIIVPEITDDSIYYLFSLIGHDATNTYNGIYYSIINMRLDNGLGDVVPGSALTPLPGSRQTMYSITCTRHHNNNDVWIVARNAYNSNYYLTYKITASGIDTIPILSQSTVNVNFPAVNQVYFMRISPDGKKFVCLYDTIMEFCNFNSTTGVISPLFHIHCTPGSVQQYFDNGGAEWSVDNKFLYVMAHNDNGSLYQFDATKNDSASFRQSEVLISNEISGANGQLQRGPDHKIYFAGYAKDSIGAVKNPSVQGIGCNFQKNLIYLLANYVYGGFPQFLQRYKVYIHYTNLCHESLTGFSADIWPPPDSLHWDFGDPASGSANSSDILTPSHTYSNAGTYTVELWVRHEDKRTDTSWQTITILDAPHPSLGIDKFICTGDSVMLDAGFWMNSTYAWDNLTAGQFNISTSQTFWAKTAGNYRVTVTNSNGCIGMDTVMVNFSPSPDVTNNPLSKSICSGEYTNIPLTSSVPGANFHWTATPTSGTVSGFSADSGLVINQVLTNTLPTPGIVTYHITPQIGSCSGNTVDFPVTVNPGVPVTISISASQNNVCAGTTVVFTATPGNQGASPVYQWKVNVINQPGNSPTFSYIPSNNDVVTCVLTSSNTVCTSNNPATSNAITMTVNPDLPVSITLTSVPAIICQGSSVTFTAHPTNGGLTPSYQWKINGVNVGPNSDTYSFIPVNGDLVSCTLSSSEPCATSNPASSIQYPVSVNPLLPVSITISTLTNPFCLGSSATFTTTPSNGGVPIYQWKVNGINVGANSSTYTYTPAGGDVVTCIINSSLPCTTGNPGTSNSIIMIVNTGLPASVSITPSSNPFCPGSSVTFTATPTNGGTPSYQWKVNGVNVGINSNTYTYNPANGDSIRCIMTSNLACVTGSPCSSAKIIMNGNLAPIVTFTACFDTITTLNAKPIKLKGGIPLGGVYSGPGVNSGTGYFNPALAGVGTKTITYSYTNSMLCSAAKSISIINFPLSIFNCGNPLTDIRDSKTYQTVQIGGQCWLSTNLNFGTILASSQDQRDNCIAEKYCYNDNPINCTNHGGLYQWDELMLFDATSAAQGFCPPGWHIPSENDWNILFSSYISNAFAGSPLKYSGFSGFNALLSGARHMNKGWDLFGFATFFWSSTSRSDSKAWAHGMNEVDPSVSLYPALRANAFSVRCLKD